MQLAEEVLTNDVRLQLVDPCIPFAQPCAGAFERRATTKRLFAPKYTVCRATLIVARVRELWGEWWSSCSLAWVLAVERVRTFLELSESGSITVHAHWQRQRPDGREPCSPARSIS
jgi:hypothetical protein